MPTTNLPTSYNGWVAFFLPEGEEFVRLRREYGDHITDPYSAALTYAGFAAFDAVMKGEAFQKLDMQRAREIAAHMTNREPAELEQAA